MLSRKDETALSARVRANIGKELLVAALVAAARSLAESIAARGPASSSPLGPRVSRRCTMDGDADAGVDASAESRACPGARSVPVRARKRGRLQDDDIDM